MGVARIFFSFIWACVKNMLILGIGGLLLAIALGVVIGVSNLNRIMPMILTAYWILWSILFSEKMKTNGERKLIVSWIFIY
jgi:hypothetical protein